MGLGINKVIELENNTKYLLLKKTMYQGHNFYLANVLNDNIPDSSSNIIFKVTMSGTETFVTQLSKNDELYEILDRIFQAQL